MMAVQDEKGEWIVAAIRKVIIDAGHGGQEPGAVYNGRMEKNDTLQLALMWGMRWSVGEFPLNIQE